MNPNSDFVREWNSLSEGYSLEEGQNFSLVGVTLLDRFPLELNDEEKAWFEAALSDERLKWFVLRVMRERDEVPTWLVSPLLQTAISHPDPSANRYFIEPVSLFYGRRRVLEELLGYARSGTDFEKMGAINAFYWAHLRSGFRWDGGERELDDDVQDLRVPVESYLLREFINNTNVEVRRSIIPQLNLKAADYPAELQSFVPQAIKIAQGHDDDYIRHRVEIQLGNSGPLKPLPSRSKNTSDSSVVGIIRNWLKRSP